MSYFEQAKGINKDLTQFFNSLYIKEFSISQREQILNLIIRVGQVAKFRCRNNSAYDNFINACFEGVATAQRVELRAGEEFKVLTATLKPLTAYEDFLAKGILEDNKENFTKWVKSVNQNYEVI